MKNGEAGADEDSLGGKKAKRKQRKTDNVGRRCATVG